MDYKPRVSSEKVKLAPRLIIHGGAGNILPKNLPVEKYKAFHDALLTIVSNTHQFLIAGHDAIDTVTYAVEQLENNPLFNSGKGAVFTREGVNELEASIMVSRGKKKRGVGVMGLQHVKNPIKLAREMLLRGEQDLDGGNGEHRGPMLDTFKGSGAQGHSQLHGPGAEKLASDWGLEIVEPSYFFTQNRWDEHIKALEKEKEGEGNGTWHPDLYISQGTCGAVALDADGVCAVATSTGGMTNKLSGRIGDTPTLGAGFWAEEWEEEIHSAQGSGLVLSNAFREILGDCLPSLSLYNLSSGYQSLAQSEKGDKLIRGTAMSGTGNGDSFLRVNAVRTASAIARYRGTKGHSTVSLQEALTEMTGPGGDLVKSAGDRWKKTGEGEGGVIGIEVRIVTDKEGTWKSAKGEIVLDYNCGGMFRALITEKGKAVARVWKSGQHEGLEAYEGEGKEYDVKDWVSEKVPF